MAKRNHDYKSYGWSQTRINPDWYYQLVKLEGQPGRFTKRLIGEPFLGSNFPTEKTEKGEDRYFEVHRVPFLNGNHEKLKQLDQKLVK